MKTPDNSLPTGYVLQGEAGQYVIQQKLGQGAFGITYLAETQVEIHGNMGTGMVSAQVAIKEFFMHELNSRDESTSVVNDLTGNSLVQKYRASFLREANHMATLSKKHPNHIVQVIEVFEANNTAYIVMQYLKGGNLDDKIKANGSLTEEKALPIFSQICEAIRFMHQNRMLHLDLKPKNVMFDEKGNAKIIDFGLSKQYNDTGEAETSTTIGLGTPGYAPNEQSEKRSAGAFPVTLDIYAMGATLYKMLTGMTPPLASVVLDNPQFISESLSAKEVSEKVVNVIVKCMSPASSKRYQSVDELMESLPEESTMTAFKREKQRMEEQTVLPASDVNPTKSGNKNRINWAIATALCVCLAIGILLGKGCQTGEIVPPVGDAIEIIDPIPAEEDALKIETAADSVERIEPVKPDQAPAVVHRIMKKTLQLGYAVWEGEVRNGEPYGEGRMTYQKEHDLGDEAHTKAQPGDAVEGSFKEGKWTGFPKLTRSDGTTEQLAM